MPLPSNSYYPLFPCQIQTVDQTTGLPLAAGTYTFFADSSPGRATRKDVYQRTENPDNTFTYSNLGSELTLSSIGTFVDESGNNIVPFLWPFKGSPDDDPPSTVIDLYYIIIESSGETPQFTVSAWPPQVTGTSSGGNTIDSSDNVISNPQFAAMNYTSPYTFSVSGSRTIQIAPDWNIITTGTGTVTINQMSVIDTAAPGLPAFALDITSSGISTLILSQTISMSPRLLEDGYASGTFIVQSAGVTTPTISMNFVPSNPSMTPPTIVSGVANIGSFTPYNSTVDLSLIAKNPDSGSTGYVDIQIVIPPSSHIYISCIQLLPVASSTTVPAYIQQSTPRQIDHLYHDAYPIVPVGTIIDFAGFAAPLHYLPCDSNEYDRVTYNQLYRALTLLSTVTLASVTTYTDTNAEFLYIGMAVEGNGIPANTVISDISGTTITISHAATISSSSTLTYFAWGNGDGSTTFNVPDLRGYVTEGLGGGTFAANYDALGYKGGANTHTVALGEIPNHTHGTVNQVVPPAGTTLQGYASGTGYNLLNSVTGNITSYPGGGQTALSLVQQTANVSKYIRYE